MIKLLFALIAIAGYIANIKDYKKASYLFWVLSNSGFGILTLIEGEWQMSIMFTVYDLFCFYGIMKILSKE